MTDRGERLQEVSESVLNLSIEELYHVRIFFGVLIGIVLSILCVLIMKCKQETKSDG